MSSGAPRLGVLDDSPLRTRFFAFPSTATHTAERRKKRRFCAIHQSRFPILSRMSLSHSTRLTCSLITTHCECEGPSRLLQLCPLAGVRHSLACCLLLFLQPHRDNGHQLGPHGTQVMLRPGFVALTHHSSSRKAQPYSLPFGLALSFNPNEAVLFLAWGDSSPGHFTVNTHANPTFSFPRAYWCRRLCLEMCLPVSRLFCQGRLDRPAGICSCTIRFGMRHAIDSADYG